MSGRAIGDRTQLGLALDDVKVTPNFIHHNVHTDDFGPDIPADKIARLSDVRINAVLVHYDNVALDMLMDESTGGGRAGNFFATGGTLAAAGTFLGGMKPVLASGCHFVNLWLSSPVLGVPWKFNAAFLNGPPLEIPLGTKRSMTRVEFGAIPYRPPLETVDQTISGTSTFVSSPGEVTSSGVILWERIEN
jgi:hypothetical protein